nr:desmoglein-2 [Pogona vitticeps]
MARHRGAGGPGVLLLLLTCVVIGNGLHLEILGGRNDQLFNTNNRMRQKREWIVPPANIWEERDNSNRNPIARIRSDREGEPGLVITYTISGQGVTEPPYQLFVINGKTGAINITGIVDREETPMLHLRAYALDQNGVNLEKPLDLRIKVLDVNDNSPVFSQQVFAGSVEELSAPNTIVMKITATDADDPDTKNAQIAFKIVSQDPSQPEAFTINRATGEVRTARFQLDREQINYEELKNIDLNIVVSNKAAYHQSIINQGYKANPIPVKISVENVREGPVFKPQAMVINGSETMKVNQVIGRYQAYDEDTGKIAENIRYAKNQDPGNWFIIDSKTAEIKLVKVPDYESRYVVNGTYTATILAISNDVPSQTATGTIVIRVEDHNDNCPTLVNRDMSVCTDAKFINITAEDRDAHPNGGPFTFILDEPERMSGKWMIGQVNGNRAQLVPQDVKPGIYEIPVIVKDNQGLACPDRQVLKLEVCECIDGAGCQGKLVSSTVMLGPAAIALIILALLLLLLVPLLLLACGFGSGTGKGFTAIPDNSEEMLRNWNSEGAAPENKAILNLIAPSALDNSASNVGSTAAAVGAGAGLGAGGGAATGGGSSSVFKEHYFNTQTTDRQWEEQAALLSGAEYRGRAGGMAAGGGMAAAGGTMTGGGIMTGGGTLTMGARGTLAMEKGGAVNEEFLRDYFNEKADTFAEEEEAHLIKDCLLVYSQDEEKESACGSVGCCSFIEDDFDDHFLDDLGDKFKTLAEICMGKHISVETSQHSSQVRQQASPSLAMNKGDVQYVNQQNTLSSEHIYTSAPSFQAASPMAPFGSGTVTEETITEATLTSKPGLQRMMNVHDPLAGSNNVVITETSYETKAPGISLDPQFKENVVVTERVLAPASNLQDVLEMPPGAFPDLPDSKYVVVRERERVLVPSSDLKASLSIPNLSEGQNVLVTQTVLTPTTNRQSTAERASFSESDRQELTFMSDPFFNQVGTQEGLPSGGTMSKSSTVKKYSSVHYTRS